MSTSLEIDVHEELSGAAIGRLHWLLGILVTLITLTHSRPRPCPSQLWHRYRP